MKEDWQKVCNGKENLFWGNAFDIFYWDVFVEDILRSKKNRRSAGISADTTPEEKKKT